MALMKWQEVFQRVIIKDYRKDLLRQDILKYATVAVVIVTEKCVG